MSDNEKSFKEEHFDYRRVVVNNLVLFVHKNKTQERYQSYSVTLFEPYSFSHVFVFSLDTSEENYTDAAMLAYRQFKEKYFSGDNLIVKEYIK
tara:strand:+ start:51 stop:329 length:279 start_codon:yes stop_codon:yes gene_type:complete